MSVRPNSQQHRKRKKQTRIEIQQHKRSAVSLCFSAENVVADIWCTTVLNLFEINKTKRHTYSISWEQKVASDWQLKQKQSLLLHKREFIATTNVFNRLFIEFSQLFVLKTHDFVYFDWNDSNSCINNILPCLILVLFYLSDSVHVLRAHAAIVIFADFILLEYFVLCILFFQSNGKFWINS